MFITLLSLYLAIALISGSIMNVANSEELYRTDKIYPKSFKLNGSHPKYQDCVDLGETFAGAVLVRREYLLNNKLEGDKTLGHPFKSKKVSVEWAALGLQHDGINFQSVDVLDFSVIHLSAYERIALRRHHQEAGPWTSKAQRDQAVMPAIQRLPRVVRDSIKPSLEIARPNQIEGFQDKTIVVIPFLGSHIGSSRLGGSRLENRGIHLASCFWSFYEHFSNIVAFVATEDDYIYLKVDSGLPWFDVIFLDHLPNTVALPVAAVQRTKAALRSGVWSFDYMFYTESDQILLMREPKELVSLMSNDPKLYLLAPHRLVPYPKQIAAYWNYKPVQFSEPKSWKNMQCCMARQYCQTRDAYVQFKNFTDKSIPMLEIFDIPIALGNPNMMFELYRHCTLSEQDPTAPYCA